MALAKNPNLKKKLGVSILAGELEMEDEEFKKYKLERLREINASVYARHPEQLLHPLRTVTDPSLVSRHPLPSDWSVSGLLAAGGFAVREARRVSWEFTVSADDLWAGVAAGLSTLTVLRT